MTEYLKPATIDEARRLGSRDGAAYVGGGTWLYSKPAGAVTTLISLEELKLAGVSRKDGLIRIGASTRFQDILEEEGMPLAVKEAVRQTASRTLRNMVTLGGDLALHEPVSCVVPALLVLEATVFLAGEESGTSVPEYVKSKSGGLIVEVRIPDHGSVSSLRSVSRTSHSRKNLVCAAAAACVNGTLEKLRIVVGDCVGDPLRLKAVEAALEGKAVPSKAAIEELVKKYFAPKSDFHAGAAYKRYMAGVIVADILHDFFDPEKRS